MSFTDILLIGVALSMDAFAVSMCQGVSMKKLNMRRASLIALFFGAFQALMPLLGFSLGSTFASAIRIGPWVACALLLVLGIKMLIDGIRNKDEDPSDFGTIGRLFLLAIATSIDAFAIGVSFAMRGGFVFFGEGTNIFLAVLTIGITTFVLSLLGVLIGNRFGLRYHRAATMLGGVILILIGIKLLLQGLHILPDFIGNDTVSAAIKLHTLWI